MAWSNLRRLVDKMHASEAAVAAGATTSLADLQALPLEELARDKGAAHILARITRQNTLEPEPVKVAAFNSYI